MKRMTGNGIATGLAYYERLRDIEDILGDEYDLDLVQKLIQAHKEGRYIIMKDPEQAGVSRLRELAQADREGRCIIAPVRPGEIAWCGFKQQDPIKGTEKHVVYPVVLRGWWTGIVDAEYDPRHFKFDQLYDSEESAQAELRRVQE